MKVFLVWQIDLDLLLTMIDRDPKHGKNGGSSQVQTKEEEQAFATAHRFYNYQVRTWIERMSDPD